MLTIGTAGVGNWQPTVKLVEVAVQLDAFVAVIVYEVPHVNPVTTPDAPTVNPAGVEV